MVHQPVMEKTEEHHEHHHPSRIVPVRHETGVRGGMADVLAQSRKDLAEAQRILAAAQKLQREKPDLNDFNLQLVTLYAQHAVASGALFVKRQERYMSELRKPVGERNVGGFPSVSDTVSLSRVEFSDYNSLLKGTKPDDVIARLSR